MCHIHITVPLIAHHFHICLHYNTNQEEGNLPEFESRVVANTTGVDFFCFLERKNMLYFLYHVGGRIIPIDAFFLFN